MKLKQPLNRLYELKVIGAAVLAAAFAVVPILAQQDGKTAVDNLLNGNKATPTPKKNPTPKIKPSPGNTGRPTGGRPTGGGTVAAVPGVPQRFRVVFNTGATGVEILANNESIGVSDKNGKLTAYVEQGEHLISARKYEQDLFDPKTIKVSNKETSFNVSAEVAKGLDKVREPDGNTVAAKPDKIEPDVTAQPVVDSRAILEAYADPQKSDTLRVEDWQAVYEQSRQKLALGNTENDIEGLFAFAQGQIEMSNKNMVKAVNSFSAATVFLPKSEIVYYGLGNAHFISGNENEAIAAFSKAIQFNNKFALPHKKLGDLYLLQKRTKEAALQYQAAKASGMDTPELTLKLAEIQIRNGNCTAAVKELEELQEKAPTAGVYIALSDCHIKQKRAVSAIETLNKAIALDPSATMAYYKVGNIYYEQKEYGKAKESFERAMTLDPEGKEIDLKEVQKMIENARKKMR